MLLALVAVGSWYLQHREESLLHTTQSIQVDRIVDGDTFVGTIAPSANAVLVGKQFRFRLRMVDAPEISQPHGTQATDALNALLFSRRHDREVVCRIWEKDTWGRLIADVFTRDNIQSAVVYVQGELVKDGHAWVFGGFAQDRALVRLAEAAKKAKTGLWAGDTPLEPWIYRRMERGELGGKQGSHTGPKREGRPSRLEKKQQQHEHRQERERLKRKR